MGAVTTPRFAVARLETNRGQLPSVLRIMASLPSHSGNAIGWSDLQTGEKVQLLRKGI